MVPESLGSSPDETPMKKQVKKKPGTVLDKAKEKIREAVKAGKKESFKEATVFILERKKHFIKKLSTTQGFGYQDLKPTYQELYRWMMNTYKDKFITRPADGSVNDFSVKCIVKLK